MEIWKDIENYEGLYQVSNLGRIKSIKRYRTQKFKQEFIMKQKTNRYGYQTIVLSKNSKREYPTIHRLVANAFLLKIKDKNEVNHIDGNKSNNNVENLEWCNASENKKHGFRLGLYKIKKGKDSTSSTPILQFDKNNVFIKRWDCISDASRTLKINKSDISSCCIGRTHYNTAGGYKWKFE